MYLTNFGAKLMDLTPKQQTSEAIRQAETILIITGQHPSVDQVCAVLGLTAILRKFGKKVSALISDGLPQAVQMLDTSALDKSASGMRDFILKLDVTKAEVEKLRTEMQDGKLNIYITPFKGSFAPSDVTFDYGTGQYDLVIALGVPTRARLDRVYEKNPATFENTPIVNIDFHRSNENYAAVNLIEPTASSLCEMLVATSESLQGGLIDEPIATTLLMGIIGSTDRFTATHTTSKSLTVAAQMMAAGARQQAVVRALYRDGKGGGDQTRGQERGGGGGERRQGQRAGQQPAEQRQTEQRTERAERVERHEAPERPVERQPASAEKTEPVRDTAPEAPRESSRGQLPIIDPGHIELSEEQKEPQAEPNPREVPPMADFAAAAEILARRNRQAEDTADERDDFEV
jgi:hypothetical protein